MHECTRTTNFCVSVYAHMCTYSHCTGVHAYPASDDVDGHEGRIQFRRQTGKPQVANLEIAVGVDQQVVWFEVPVHHVG